MLVLQRLLKLLDLYLFLAHFQNRHLDLLIVFLEVFLVLVELLLEKLVFLVSHGNLVLVSLCFLLESFKLFGYCFLFHLESADALVVVWNAFGSRLTLDDNILILASVLELQANPSFLGGQDGLHGIHINPLQAHIDDHLVLRRIDHLVFSNLLGLVLQLLEELLNFVGFRLRRKLLDLLWSIDGLLLLKFIL